MPSSWSSSLRIELQYTGENINVWGDKLNADLRRVDESIAGWSTKALTGNYALVTANDNTDEAHVNAWKFTGTGAFTVSIPAVPKAYDIWNALTGVLTVSNGSAAVTLQAGEVVRIVTDGGAALVRVQPTDMGGAKITSLGTPVANTDAATKLYVDNTAWTANSGILPGQGGHPVGYLSTNSTVASWRDFNTDVDARAAALAIVFGRRR